ncbi:MAG: VWA domain-containing protein [Bryobacteraceae bacterium]
MSLLNLGIGELMALIAGVSGVLVALYLLDRSKRKQVVATLRFWTNAPTPEERKHRKRIQQPLSLLLQLLSMILLLLAIAQLRWGGQSGAERDHVLLLDTSAWMAARSGQATLMDEARTLARSYVRGLSSSDRVMIVRVDGLATPVTQYENNRKNIEAAIAGSKPSSAALRLDDALEFAKRAQKIHGSGAGEVVYVGPGRVADSDSSAMPPANLRWLPTKGSPQDCGIRKMGLRRAPADAATWEIFVGLKNYGSRDCSAPLALQFGGAPAASKLVTVKAGSEQEVTFNWRTRAAGWLEARFLTKDAFPQDDRAIVELPAQQPLRVIAYTNEPELLRPVLAANPYVEAVFEKPAKYDPNAAAAVVILDRFAPPSPPKSDSIWIEPPSANSPVAVRATKTNAKLSQWHAENRLGAGLRTKGTVIDSTLVFNAQPNDMIVADSDGQPIILGRPSSPKIGVFGFQPTRTSMKYELATPLVFANFLRWMAPQIFRHWEVNAGSVGAITAPLEKGFDPATVRVLTENKGELPFTISGQTVKFFAGAPGIVRVLSDDRELVYSLTLPDVGETLWKAPSNVRRGIPKWTETAVSATDLWMWLAIAGGLGLLIDWFLFGRGRGSRFAAPVSSIRIPWRKAS